MLSPDAASGKQGLSPERSPFDSAQGDVHGITLNANPYEELLPATYLDRGAAALHVWEVIAYILVKK
jgi:hypothetical protein